VAANPANARQWGPCSTCSSTCRLRRLVYCCRWSYCLWMDQLPRHTCKSSSRHLSSSFVVSKITLLPEAVRPMLADKPAQCSQTYCGTVLSGQAAGSWPARHCYCSLLQHTCQRILQRICCCGLGLLPRRKALVHSVGGLLLVAVGSAAAPRCRLKGKPMVPPRCAETAEQWRSS
jgi:hypothetical protein